MRAAVVGGVADGPVNTQADVVDSHEVPDVVHHIDILAYARQRGEKGRVLRMGGVLDTPTQISVRRVHADEAARFGSALNLAVGDVTNIVV